MKGGPRTSPRVPEYGTAAAGNGGVSNHSGHHATINAPELPSTDGPTRTIKDFLQRRGSAHGGSQSLGSSKAPSHGSQGVRPLGSMTSSVRSTAFGDNKISMSTLIVLVFYGVSGGPFGIEAAVGAGGSAVALLGFLILPFVWAIPEALVCAELSTAFPEASGFVAWVEHAFGPFWGFMEGYTSWLSGVTDNALYPVLFFEYLIAANPALAEDYIRYPGMYIMVAVLIFLNYHGLEVVGRTSLIICLFSLAPFVIMVAMGIPKMSWERLTLPPEGGYQNLDMPLFLNLMFWNYNYWDSAAVFAGEVHEPAKTFPRAMGSAVVLVVVAYTLPLVVGIAATTGSMGDWDDGYFAVAGREIAGPWLGYWIVAAAAISNIGMFMAELSSDSFQVMGMSERGMLPKAFMKRSSKGAPTYALALSAGGIAFLVTFDFHEIIELLNFLYCGAELLEFAAFIKLRYAKPDLHRPFRIPLSNEACVLMLTPPVILIIYLMSLASTKTWVCCTIALVLGTCLRFGLMHMKRNNVVPFVHTPRRVHPCGYESDEMTPLLVSVRSSTTHLTFGEAGLMHDHDHLVAGKRGRTPVVTAQDLTPGNTPLDRHLPAGRVSPIDDAGLGGSSVSITMQGQGTPGVPAASVGAEASASHDSFPAELLPSRTDPALRGHSHK